MPATAFAGGRYSPASTPRSSRRKKPSLVPAMMRPKPTGSRRSACGRQRRHQRSGCSAICNPGEDLPKRQDLPRSVFQLRYAGVVAPDDGVITSARTATPPEPSRRRDRNSSRMIRQGHLEWRGELTAPAAGAGALGQQITLDLPDGTPCGRPREQAAPAMDERSRLGRGLCRYRRSRQPRTRGPCS